MLATNPDPNRFTPVWTEGRRVTGFGGHGIDPQLFTGVSIHSPEVLSRIPEGFASLVKDLWQPMLSGERPRLSAIVTDARFFDLGSPRDFLDASIAALEDGGPFDPRGGDYDAASQTLSLGAPGGNVRRSVIGRAAIDAGACVDDSIVWDGARIEGNTELSRCLVGPVELPRGFAAADALVWPGPDGQPASYPF